MKLSKKDEALRIALKVFYAMYYGATFNQDELRTFYSVCGLALPMKHRLNRQEVEEIRGEKGGIALFAEDKLS